MMTDPLTLIIGLVAIVGAAFGYWRYFAGQIAAARQETADVKQVLADYKTHVAETYVTKQGMSEQTSQIMDAIHGLKSAIDTMMMRLDRVVESQHKPRHIRSSDD